MATSITWARTCRVGAPVNCPACFRRLPRFTWGYLAYRLDLDSAFSAEALKSCPDVASAVATFNSHLAPEEHLALDAALSAKQQALSMKLDDAGWHEQLQQASILGKATLQSEACVGARAFLAAVPVGPNRMEPATFVAELRVRLGIPDAGHDCWCPRCDGIFDIHTHHAGMCAAGGERTQRHHALRDLVFAWAEGGGLRPERERPGLLLPQSPHDISNSNRRPADVYLPALAGSPAALDFAVTAPQRQETLVQASQKGGAAATAYAQHKATYLQTGQACEVHGVQFIPMVIETTGAWDPAATKILKHIAHAFAARTGADLATALGLLHQEACVCLRSWRARAALRRRCELHA